MDRIVEEPDEMKDFFLDITKYEKQSVIKKGDIFKLCKLKEKETGNFFTGQLSMMKIIKFSNEALDNLQREIDILLHMNHPTLLKFIGFSPVDFKNQRRPVIVMELISDRSLEDIFWTLKEWNFRMEFNKEINDCLWCTCIPTELFIVVCNRQPFIWMIFFFQKSAISVYQTKFINKDNMTTSIHIWIQRNSDFFQPLKFCKTTNSQRQVTFTLSLSLYLK